MTVLLGNGDGTLGAGVSSGTGESPLSLAVGNFDGDGLQDLVTANYGLPAGGGFQIGGKLSHRLKPQQPSVIVVCGDIEVAVGAGAHVADAADRPSQ